MDETPRGAILQRDKETYAIVPRIPLGLLTPDVLEKIASVARKYAIPAIKITAGQRIALVGIKAADVEKIWQELGMEPGNAVGHKVHYVQSCPGNEFCKFGQGDSIGLSKRLEKAFDGVSLPAKLKMAVSGCKLNCAGAYLTDIGAFAAPGGWTVVAGGNSGGRPRIADVIAEGLSDDAAFDLIKRCVDYYSKNARPIERMPRFIARVGLEEFKKNVMQDGI